MFITIKYHVYKHNYRVFTSPISSLNAANQNHTIDVCPLRKFKSGLQPFDKMEDNATNWMEITVVTAIANQNKITFKLIFYIAA